MNTPLIRRWFAAAEALQPDTIALRRAIHAEPELGLGTAKTLAKVKAALAGLPLTYREAGSCSGMIATREGARPGRTVLLRGDMDALPMPEDTGLPYRSQTPNVMHACGHDAHTAMLAGAARLLAARQPDLAGRILFMFQPGEEGHDGARHMIQEGLLDDPAPDAAFALHVAPNLPAGVLGARVGPMLASADYFEILIRGHGGHGAMPHDAIDPMPAACEMVMALQSFVTRRISVFDPVIISVTQIDGGTTDNVIPETVRMRGSMRALSEDTRAKALAAMDRIVGQVALAHECTAAVTVGVSYPVTVNDPAAVALAERAIKAALGDEAWRTLPNPIMGSEDFSHVLNRVPGAFVWLGVCPEGETLRTACPCHSNKMTLNEIALAHGVAAHCALAETFLAEGFG